MSTSQSEQPHDDLGNVPRTSPTNTPQTGNPPTHQGGNNTGGIPKDLRVLLCENVDLSLDYHGIYMVLKRYGPIERIKLAQENSTYNCYATFESSTAAQEACWQLRDYLLNDRKLRTELLNAKNILDHECDYVPKETETAKRKLITRKSPNLIWYVATYKDGQSNLVKAADLIESRVGNIPKGNLSRYGRSILIKAGTNTQATLLKNFTPPEEGNVQRISPHRTFNTKKAVVYCRDLACYEDAEILNMCPPYVYEARKAPGRNGTIFLTLTSENIPDEVAIKHLRLRVKKFKLGPYQCTRCLEFGHPTTSCDEPKRCLICTKVHEGGNPCSGTTICYHCQGAHLTTSRDCPAFIYEQDVRMTAEDQHISLGEARRLVLGAGIHSGATYSKATKNRNQSGQSRRRSIPRPSQPSSSTYDQSSRKESPTPGSSTPKKEKTRENDPRRRSPSVRPKATNATSSSTSTHATPGETGDGSSKKNGKSEKKGDPKARNQNKSSTKDADGFIPPPIQKRAKRSSLPVTTSFLALSNAFDPLNLEKKDPTKYSHKRDSSQQVKRSQVHSSDEDSLEEGLRAIHGIIKPQPTLSMSPEVFLSAEDASVEQSSFEDPPPQVLPRRAQTPKRKRKMEKVTNSQRESGEETPDLQSESPLPPAQTSPPLKQPKTRIQPNYPKKTSSTSNSPLEHLIRVRRLDELPAKGTGPQVTPSATLSDPQHRDAQDCGCNGCIQEIAIRKNVPITLGQIQAKLGRYTQNLKIYKPTSADTHPTKCVCKTHLETLPTKGPDLEGGSAQSSQPSDPSLKFSMLRDRFEAETTKRGDTEENQLSCPSSKLQSVSPTKAPDPTPPFKIDPRTGQPPEPPRKDTNPTKNDQSIPVITSR